MAALVCSLSSAAALALSAQRHSQRQTSLQTPVSQPHRPGRAPEPEHNRCESALRTANTALRERGFSPIQKCQSTCTPRMLVFALYVPTNVPGTGTAAADACSLGASLMNKYA